MSYSFLRRDAFRPALFAVILCVCCVLLSLAHLTRSFADDGGLLLKFIKSAQSAQDSTYTLTLQNDVRGKMQSAETIAVRCAKDGSVYAHWTGKANKDRELIYRPGWNDGKAWIKEGGPLSFSAVSMGLQEGTIKNDYRRSIDFFALSKAAQEFDAWLKAGTASTSSDGQTVTITADRGDLAKVEFRFGADKNLKKATFFNKTGKALEIYEYSDLKFNAPADAKAFDPSNSAYRFPGYSKDGAFIDPEMLKTNLTKSYASVKDYTTLLKKRERIGNSMQEIHNISVKFMKPMNIYMKWNKGPREGREMIYRQGKDEKLMVHEGGLLNVVTVNLALDSSMVKADTNHPITDMDIGAVINLLHKNLSRSIGANEAKLKFLGMQVIGGRRCYVMESRVPKGKGYYCPHSISAHDIVTGLPLQTKSYDDNDQLFEEFTWTDFKYNVGLTDSDFDPKNKAYKF